MRLRPVVQLTELAFTLDGDPVEVDIVDGESLLSVLRERLRIATVKDGCAPQGQCGCCTVLVDGAARVACVTPATRVAGRSVTTLAGLAPDVLGPLVDAFVATGGSQCGFCTPGILVRLAAARTAGRTTATDVDRALAAHLCRCTGWQTIREAVAGPVEPEEARDLVGAANRAELEGGGHQAVGPATPLGDAGFADDTAPEGSLVAVPLPPGSSAPARSAAGLEWVVAESVTAARAAAGKVQGRRTTAEERPPLPLPPLPAGGVRLATGWVEPAYLETDASWCVPGGAPASPLANGGAFGGKVASAAPGAARELADATGRTVRVLYSREDAVRLGPKRPPIAASAIARDGRVTIRGTTLAPMPAPQPPYDVDVDARWEVVTVPGPPVSNTLRAVGLAEHTALVEGALDAAGWDRRMLVDERGAAVLLDTLAASRDGALAGARVELDETSGAVRFVTVRVDAGDPLDVVALRSYVIGAVHMALGWTFTESIAVDPDSGDVLDLTIRSFGVIRPKHMPPVEVEILAARDAPRGGASDATFAAVAAAAWNATTRIEGVRPETFPAAATRAARMLRR